jgi:elongation factor G
VKERFGSLFFMNGKNQTPVKEAGPGAIFAVAKLKDTHIGDTISAVQNETPLPGIEFPEAVMSYAVTAVKSGDDEKISVGLAKIRECDPTVRLRRDEITHELLLSGMGDQHLAIVAKRLKDQFKVEAQLGIPKVPYRETITSSGEGHYRHKKQTGGAGQFAEVYIRIAPNEAGYEFVNEVVGGTIPRNFIPAVEKGVAETMGNGPLVGCTVERVRVAVYDGKYHPVDSNEMAFKIAARMAFKEAVGQANPVLLEPVMHVDVHIPDAYTGDVTGDLNHKRGRILGMSVEEGMEVVSAEVPYAEIRKYATELRSMTQGRGSFEMSFVRYEQVPPNVANEIIAAHQAEVAAEQ